MPAAALAKMVRGVSCRDYEAVVDLAFQFFLLFGSNLFLPLCDRLARVQLAKDRVAAPRIQARTPTGNQKCDQILRCFHIDGQLV